MAPWENQEEEQVDDGLPTWSYLFTCHGRDEAVVVKLSVFTLQGGSCDVLVDGYTKRHHPRAFEGN